MSGRGTTGPGRATFVAVGPRTEERAEDPALARRAERRALDRRVRDAALHAVAAHWPWLGTLILAQSPLAVLAAAATVPDMVSAAMLLFSVATSAVMLLTRVMRWRTSLGSQVGLALAGAVCLSLPAALSDPRWSSVHVALAAVFGTCAASLQAPVVGVMAVVAAIPLAAAAASSIGGALDPVAAAIVGTAGLAAALLAGGHRHLAWRRTTRALADQQERIRRLEAERDQALLAVNDKTRFLAIASHDLRQPVHALALFTATLHKRLQGAPDEPLARNMVRAIDGLERSFNAMLDVSRLDADAVAPTQHSFALRDVFRRLHMHYAGQAEIAGLGLRFSPGGKSVTSDPQMLERALGNLIQNAIKYTEDGGIVVVARSTATHVNVEVWDTGPGIAAVDLPRIFDEFSQVGREGRDRMHGLGMGLSIVKRLVRALGHTLEVHSTVGKGTMFRIGIPRGGLPGLEETLGPAETQPMVVNEPQTILLIDDEEPIREGLRLLLGEWGFQTVAAADAAQAEQCARALEGRIDLILSDLHLGPGPDGLEAIDAVRRLCLNDVQAILITGDTAGDQLRRIAASGHLVLFKPLQPRRLFEAMRDLLQ